MASEASDLLLYALRESNLLDAGRLAELQDWAIEFEADPSAISKEVASRGWLTAFQMREISRGRARGLVIGPYVLLDLLGEGGMGRVFKAHHTRLGRDVALKVIRKEKLSKPIVVQRFHQEIRATAQLSHPNVVLAFDADEIDGMHFFAMEYVEGTDLTKLVREKGPIPIPLACDYIRQSALGLQHAFERGLVHRDVKPSNLLVTPRGQVKVLDLGLALLKENPGGEDAGRVTQEGLVLGTPDFLAPEQAQNPQGVDIRADIYGLGATLYYLVSGRVPYEGGTPTEKLLMHVTAPPPSLLQVMPHAPPQLDALIQWMMAKRPEDRPQTPVQAAYALIPFCPPAGGSGPSGPGSGFVPHPTQTVPVASTPSPVDIPMGHPVSPPYPPVYQPPVATTPMPAAPYPAAPLPYPAAAPYATPQPSGDPFGFGGGETSTAPTRSNRKALDEDDERPSSERKPARKPGGSGALKWIVIGLVAFCGCGGIGAVGYMVLDSIRPETPPPAEFDNPAGMKMVLLPAGSFRMGSPDGEHGRAFDEGPVGEVAISKPFSMAATEVTEAQYRKVMGNSPAVMPRKMSKAADFPVDSVSWDLANDFCAKLTLMDRNRKSGWGYRLPTEAEWEYACRAKTTGPFWCGEKLPFGKNAIFDLRKDRNEGTDYGEDDPVRAMETQRIPHYVKFTEKNEFGLYDMHGNVWEWCQDYYAPNYDGRADSDPKGPATGDGRVIRGGSWKETAAECRSAKRRSMAPIDKQTDVGFRVVYAPIK